MDNELSREELLKRISVLEKIVSSSISIQTLKDSHFEVWDILDAAADVIIVTDSSGVIIRANAEASRRLGLPEAELCGRLLWDMFSAEVARNRKPHFDKVACTGRTERFEDRRGDTWFDHLIFPINSGRSDDFIIAVISRDITRRKVMENTIRTTRNSLHQIITVLPVMTMALDENGMISMWNRECQRVTGYEACHVVYRRDAFDCMYPDSEYRRRIMSVFDCSSKDFSGLDVRTVCRDGDEKIISWSKISRDDPVNRWCSIAVGEDVTEHRRLENEIKWSRNLLCSTLNALGNTVTVIDRNMRVIMTNSGEIADGLSLNNERPLCYECIHKRKTPCESCRVDEVFSSGKMVEFPYTSTEDGSRMEVRMVPIFGNNGEVILVVEDAHDITDLLNAQEEKRIFESRLKQAEKLEAIGRLAGGIAHDFNNILSAIIGFSELTIDDLPEGSRERVNINQILDAGLRAKDLVMQILTFSRKIDAEKKPVTVNSLIIEALKLLRPSIPSSIEIDIDIAEDACMVMADSSQVHQMIVNLCTNAYQAMEKNGGILSISLEQCDLEEEFTKLHPSLAPGPYVKLEVGDTGSGMDKRTRDLIFDPFFTTKGRGTGLGLATVHGIVTTLGGDIIVESEENCGSSFAVYLPRINIDNKTDVLSDEVVPMGKGQRILMVDDEPAILDMGKKMLERLGYGITVSNTAAETLETFRKSPDDFDLVITDYTMPGILGDKLASELHKIREDIPVILITGFSDSVNRDNARAVGIKEFVGKPFTRMDIGAAVNSVLKKNIQ